jgi:chromosome segregation ATPase
MASKKSKKTTGRKPARKAVRRKPAIETTRKWVTVEHATIDTVNREFASSIREQGKLVTEKQKEFESHQVKISSQKDLYQSRQDGLEKMRTKLLNLEKLIAEKQKEFELYQRNISWRQYLHQSRQDGLVKMRTRLLNLQTQYKVLHMQTDSHRKLLDETRQRYSMDDLEVEHHELESEIESKRDEIADLKKQKQTVLQQTEQITQKISEQQKQLADHTDILSSHLEMVEKQKTVILEEIAQVQAKKQAQEDELQSLTKERLGLVSKNKDKQGMDEQIQKHRNHLHAIQNERSMLELEIKSQMVLLDEERQKEKKIMANILQKYN